jgi:creatinine amidohydrolase
MEGHLLTWNELSWPQIEERANDGHVVIIPVGVIEQHGHHLPVDTDAFIPQEITREAGRRDSEILVGPTIHFGYTPSNKNFPGSISLSSGTWMALIRDVVRSVARHGFTRIALLNGHGGQVVLSRLTASILQDEDDIQVVVLDWFGLVAKEMSRLFVDENLSGSSVGHAGAVETSINLHLRPELSDQGERVAHLGPTKPQFVSRVGGFLQTPREQLSSSGVIGDPRLATADKGAELFELAVRRLCSFAAEYRRST